MKKEIQLTVEEVWTILNNGKLELEDYSIKLKGGPTQ